ncbi:hypothetical protein [Halorussus salinus]|nr:hypothetical protein [Halorussus salinus]
MSVTQHTSDVKAEIETEYARDGSDALDDSSEPMRACSCYTRICCDIDS